MCDGFRGGTRVPIDVWRVRACGEERVGRGGCEDERETAML
jgi:hypothetical protein